MAWTFGYREIRGMLKSRGRPATAFLNYPQGHFSYLIQGKEDQAVEAYIHTY